MRLEICWLDAIPEHSECSRQALRHICPDCSLMLPGAAVVDAVAGAAADPIAAGCTAGQAAAAAAAVLRSSLCYQASQTQTGCSSAYYLFEYKSGCRDCQTRRKTQQGTKLRTKHGGERGMIRICYIKSVDTGRVADPCAL